MNATLSEREFDNPFCTRRVQPGALPYQFSGDGSLDEIITRLRAEDWRGAIIGPHGAGKSTLLAMLTPRLETLGRRVVRVDLHDRERSLPSDALVALDCGVILVIDGYEQLSWLSRLRIGRRCRRSGCGLLVTAHADVRLPVIHRTTTTLALARHLADRLLGGGLQPVTNRVLAAAFATHEGNLREVLFALYDHYESHKALSS